jgi:hypothetical protein
MKTPRTEKKGITQTSSSNARSSSIEALRPSSGNTNTGNQDTARQASCGPNPPPVAPLTATISHERVTERAKAIWVQRGRVAGQDQADWYEAEAQLRAES